MFHIGLTKATKPRNSSKGHGGPNTRIRTLLCSGLLASSILASTSCSKGFRTSKSPEATRAVAEWNEVYRWKQTNLVYNGQELLIGVSFQEWADFHHFIVEICKRSDAYCRRAISTWKRYPIAILPNLDSKITSFIDPHIPQALTTQQGHWDWMIRPRPTSRKWARIRANREDAWSEVNDTLRSKAARLGYQFSDKPDRFGTGTYELIRLKWEANDLEVESQAMFNIEIGESNNGSTVFITPILMGCHVRYRNEPWSRCGNEIREKLRDGLDKIVEDTLLEFSSKNTKASSDD